MTFKPEPILQDVRIRITCQAGVLMDAPLNMAAIAASLNEGTVFAFVYDRNVPDEEGNHTPDIRKARLIIADDGPLV